MQDGLAPYFDAFGAGLGSGTGLEATIVEEERVQEKGFSTAIVSADGDEAVLSLVRADMLKGALIDYELYIRSY